MYKHMHLVIIIQENKWMIKNKEFSMLEPQ